MTRSGAKRAVACRTIAAAVAAASAGLALPAGAVGDGPSCANGFYVINGVELVQLDERADRTRVVGTLPVQVNAIDHEPAQDRFFGVASYPDGAHLVAIEPSGRLVDLGPAPEGTGDAYAGAIGDRRWYLHGLGDLVVVDVDLHSPRYLQVVARQPLDRTADLGDWAVNPADGLLYGIDATGPDPGRLTTVDPATGRVTGTALTSVPGSRPYGAAVIDRSGVLHALRNGDGRMFHVPLADPDSATTSPLGLTARSTDAAGCPQAWDYGDAPNSYGTTLSANGPRHTIDAFDQQSIGDAVDAEPDGRPSPDASADGNSLPAPITVAIGHVDVRVPVRNDTGRRAFLAGWIDLDGDGRFERSERAQSPVAAGEATITLHWSRGVTTTDELGFLRLRLYADPPADPLPTGPASGGEVEDHQVRFRWPKTEPAPAPAAQPADRPTSPEPTTTTDPRPSRSPSAPRTKPTVEYAAAQPPDDEPPSSTLPIPLTIFVGALVPAVVVAARGAVRAARSRR